jgi:predicted metalloprotease with PDZ domain
MPRMTTMFPRLRTVCMALVALALTALAVTPALAQTREHPVRITVDGRDWPRGILHARLTFPAPKPGPMTLYFPKWIPGTHRPEGPIEELAGLYFNADGRSIPWRRDTLDYYTFHCDVPAGTRSLDVRLDALDASTATDLGFYEWCTLVLYPAGPPVTDLYYQAAVKLPPGWTCSTALDSVSASAAGNEYATVSLYTLMDSPVLAGAHTRRVDLGASFGAKVDARIYCSSVEGLDFKPDFVTKLRAIVTAADTLFGARHFDHYRFLIGLGDLSGDLTVEHHQSHMYLAKERDLLDRGPMPLALANIAHEFAHSWCGKYRRPVGLTFHDYQHPENSELLWVYEGFDQYLGYVLNGRSGMFSESGARMQFVRAAAMQAQRPGRRWKPLRDTAIESGPLRSPPGAWASWRRGQDYYVEGALIWLEADATIRRLSRGRKSLDDFCKRFFGGANTGPIVNPYSETQVVEALQAVQPFDWQRFLDERVDAIAPATPTRALEASGWRLAYADTMTESDRAVEAQFKGVNLGYSLEISMRGDGTITDVISDGPAGKAGMAPGMKLLGVDGRTYSKEVLIDALKAAKTSHRPMELLVQWGEKYKTFSVDCSTGPRYAAAQRITGQPDDLDALLHAKPVK